MGQKTKTLTKKKTNINVTKRFKMFSKFDEEGVTDQIHSGRSVFKIKASTYVTFMEISGEKMKEGWDWQTFYVSDKTMDNLTADEVKEELAAQQVMDYYEGQRENGIVDIDTNKIDIYNVEKYDNINIDELDFGGETYRVKLLKDINTKEFILQNNQCFFDYLCYKTRKVPNFKGYSRKRLLKELGSTKLSIDMVEQWIKKGTKNSSYDKNISIYAWWESGKQAYKFQTNNPDKNTIALNVVVSDEHVHPIENDEYFTAKKLKDLKILTSKMGELEENINWRFDHHFNNYIYIDNETYDKNKDAILEGTYKPEYEALIIEERRNKEDRNDPNNITLIKVGNDVMKKTKYKLSYVNIRRQVFKHPTSKTHQTYLFCEDFIKRKKICDILFEKTKFINFKFDNQSLGEISLTLLNYYFDNMKKWLSSFHPELQEKIDKLCIKPLVQGLDSWDEEEATLNPYDEYKHLITWDGKKNYTMAMYETLKEELIPIYHLGDSIETFDIEKHIWTRLDNKLKHYLFYIPTIQLEPYKLIIPEGIYPHILIQLLLNEKHITFDDIKYCIPCKQHIQGTDISNFVKNIYDLLKDDTSIIKDVINVAAGLFNTKYESKKDEVLLSASSPFTIAYHNWFLNQNIPNSTIEVTGVDDIDWIRTQSKIRKIQDTSVINQYIVAGGMVRTLKMLKEKWQDGMKLIGFKTDAIYLGITNDIRDKNILYKNSDNINFENIHPSFYEKACIAYETNEEKKEDEWVVENESLDMIQKYPYKIEQNKKPPKYDRTRLDTLKRSIGEVNKIFFHKPETITQDIIEIQLKNINDMLNSDEDIDKIKLINICREYFNVLICGTAGSGKTTLGIKIQEVLVKVANLLDQEVLITSFQRSTVSSWITKVYETNEIRKKNKKDFIPDAKYYNWDNFYGNLLKNGIIKREARCKIGANNIFAIMIDEFSQMPERCLLDLCSLLQQNPNIILIPIGDNQQMPGIGHPVYDWMKSDVMGYFVSKVLYKEYIPESGRFPKQVLKLVKLLEENTYESIKKFTEYLKKGNFENNNIKKIKYHICAYRHYKSKYNVPSINKIICPKIKKNGCVICDKKYETKQVYKNGKPVMKDNKQEKIEILVGEKYTVVATRKNKETKILECKLAVNDYGKICYGWFPVEYTNQKNETFTVLSPGNASTAFREQGREITEPYIIHDADSMPKQALIVSISRGKHKNKILFSFTNIEKLLKKKRFRCCYESQSKLLRIPGSYKDYHKTTIKHRDKINEYGLYLLYIITDDNGGVYVGQHKYNPKKTLEENLNDRMVGHLDKNKKEEKLSPVLDMVNPVIKPFYGDINDTEPYLMYGTYKDILKIERKHIRQKLYECIKNNKKCFNKDGTKLKPKIDEKVVKKYNVLNEDIQDMIKEFTIVSVRNGTAYVLNGKMICEELGRKGKTIELASYEKLLELKRKAIAELCLCSVDKVKENEERIKSMETAE